MRAVNIKWDVTDATEDMTQEEINDILKTLPTEVEIPDYLVEDYKEDDFDYYYSDISDWLSNEFAFCHHGFELTEQQIKGIFYREMDVDKMRGLCIQLFHYITEAIDLRLSDDEINARLEEVANRDDIEPNEYCEIYEQVMLAYKVKFGI